MGFTFTKIKETCLYVTDLERTRQFYQDLLGLPLIGHKPGRHIFFRAGASVLLCFIADATRDDVDLPAHYGIGTLHFAFEVERDAYPDALEALAQAGIAIEHEHEWPGGYRSVYFRDPDDHCVEIVQAGMWEQGA